MPVDGKREEEIGCIVCTAMSAVVRIVERNPRISPEHCAAMGAVAVLGAIKTYDHGSIVRNLCEPHRRFIDTIDAKELLAEVRASRRKRD